MSGLFVGAFLSHFLGFIGPFAFVGKYSFETEKVNTNLGIVSFLLALFLSKMILFVKASPKTVDEDPLTLKLKEN